MIIFNEGAQVAAAVFSRALISSLAKFNNTSSINWKPLFELKLNKNSTKTIRLFALDFYEVIADSAFGLINNHLIENSSS